MNGLSVGQREALQLGTDSKLESVMGEGGGSFSGKATKVIDVDDLVDDMESENVGVSDSVGDSDCVELGGLGSTGGKGSADKSSTATGMGGSSGQSNQPAGGTNTYLNNPVSADSAWLHNQQLPSVLLKHEKVEHRIMLYLKGQGKSNREVAEYMGYSDGQVSQIVRQPWFVKDLRELLVNEGADLIRKTLEGTALDSIITLVSIRDNDKAPAAVRVGAANSLLDRLLGKPKQEVSVEKKENPLQRVGAVNEELSDLETREQELKKQLARLNG